MAGLISPERKEQFKQDAKLLKEKGIPHKVVAAGMGMEPPNFNRYFNSDKPGKNGEVRSHQPTEDFLERFYAAWEEKLDELRGKQDQVSSATTPLSTVEEDPAVFEVKNYKEELLDSLRKNNDALIHGFDKALDNITKLVDSNKQLVETNNQLVQSQLELIRDQRGGPGSPRESI